MEARRATVEDLEQLRDLWKSAGLAPMELEKRFTEFQVAIDPSSGKIVATFGLHIERQQGLLHSAAFADSGPGPTIWPVLWERIQSIAKNNGLIRVWTLLPAPILLEKGFVPADGEALKKIPPGFGNDATNWLTLKLREDLPAVSLEHEFKLFAETSKDETARLMQQAQVFKILAYILLVFFSIGAIVLMVFAFMRGPRNN